MILHRWSSLLIILFIILRPQITLSGVWEPGVLEVNENDYPKIVEWNKEPNLLNQEVTDIFNFDMFNSEVSSEVWQMAKPPAVSFSLESTRLWKQLNFPDKPFVISSLNASELLSVTPNCKPQVNTIFEMVRNYSYAFTSNQERESNKLWIEIQQYLQSNLNDTCYEYVRNAYIVAAVSIYDPSSSMSVNKFIHSKTGFRLARNMPVILLAAYLFNHNKLFLFSKNQIKIDQFTTPTPLSSKDFSLYGAYQCETHSIFLSDELPPFNLAGSFYHELSHAFRDSFLKPENTSPSLSNKQYLLMDEAISVVTGAQSQLDLVDHFISSDLRQRRHFSPSTDPFPFQSDLNLYDTKGKLSELFYLIYRKPENRSLLTGTPPWMFPDIRPMALTYLDVVLANSFLHKSLEKQSNHELQEKELNTKPETYQPSMDLIAMIAKAYFPVETSPITHQDNIFAKLDSNFDPFSLWLARASNFLLMEGTLIRKLEPLSEKNQESRRSQLLVKNENGKSYFAYEKKELIHLPQTSHQRIQLQISESNELYTITYDLHSLLKWLNSNADSLMSPSVACRQFNHEDSHEFDSYIGKHLQIDSISYQNNQNNSDNTQPNTRVIKPGGNGVKPNGNGVKPGGNGVKPSGNGVKPGNGNIKPSLNSNTIIIRPNISVKNL